MVRDTVLSMSGETADPAFAAASEIRRGVARLARCLRSERPARGTLSAGKVGVLGHLYRFGPSTPGEVAAAEHQQPQSLTRVFAGLAADGLISRARSEGDRRSSVVDLTERGREVLRHDMEQRDRWLTAALAGLTGAEVQVLRIAATLMDQIADAATAARPPTDGTGTP